MTRWIGLFVLSTALGAQAEGLPDRQTAAGIAEFTAAYQAWDGRRFARAAELCQHAVTNETASCTNFYWLGVAHFHQMLQLQSEPAAPFSALGVAAAMEAALAALSTAVKLDARHAESHALLGTLYGMKIDGNLVRGARFGPRVSKHRKLALATGADNPRVQYLLGTCLFHTARKPAQQREALAAFLQAEQLFAAEAKTPAAPLEPRWGYATCLTFIGQTCEKLGEGAKAADYFRKALARHPADHLAREGLARVTKGK